MTDHTQHKSTKKKGSIGNLLTGLLILAVIIGGILMRSGILEEDFSRKFGGAKGSQQSSSQLDEAEAITVSLGEDFSDKLDMENGTLIHFKTGDAGDYYAAAKASGDMNPHLKVYKYAPRGNAVLDGSLISSDRSGNYTLALDGSRHLPSNTDYYVFFQWEGSCTLEEIYLVYEAPAPVEPNEETIKEYGAVLLTADEPYTGPFLIGEENWFYMKGQGTSGPTFDFTFATPYRNVLDYDEYVFYRQEKDGNLFPLGDNCIYTGLESDRIMRWKPVFSELPPNQTYFLMVKFDDDRKLKSITATYSKLS